MASVAVLVRRSRAQHRRACNCRTVRPVATGALEEHHPLAQRRMVAFWNHGILAALGKTRAQHDRVGNEPADGVPRRGELRRLSDGVSQHERRPHRIPQSALPQHGFGRLAVRGNVGIRNGKPAHAAPLDEPRQPLEPFVDGREAIQFGAKITSLPTAYTTPASRVRPAVVSWLGNSSSAARNSSKGAPSWICRVNVPDAPNTTSTRAAAVAGELFGDLLEREVEIGRGRYP